MAAGEGEGVRVIDGRGPFSGVSENERPIGGVAVAPGRSLFRFQLGATGVAS